LGNVTFLDPLPKPRLAALLAGSQIGVQCLAPVPEFAEWTAPNKLMDYLAAGLPVVANLPGRAARLLAEGLCGIAAPPGNTAALGEALATLAADPARRAALGMAGRQAALTRFGWEQEAARLVALYRRLAPLPESGPVAAGSL
jgi:glycosyltransferase involved in cell wall biosynthesis